MKLEWNAPGSKKYDTGVDRGVLFHRNQNNEYDDGEAWQGLTGVTKSPSGGESNKQYADNMEWMNILSVEMLGLTIECLMFPDGFYRYDGLIEMAPGVFIGQQNRPPFGFAWRSLKIDDSGNESAIIHLAWDCLAQPSEKADNTVNDTPEPAPFSYTVSTTARPVEGFKPTSYLEIHEDKVDAGDFAAFTSVIWGTDLVNPSLPDPASVAAIFGGVILVVATKPAYNAGTDTMTIPAITGVEYLVDGAVTPSGPVVLTEDAAVTARPLQGYAFNEDSDNDWLIEFT